MTSVLPSRVFITGSSDGLGLLAGRLLAGQGHQVTLHARDEARAGHTRAALPEAEAVVTGDLASLAGMRQVADQVAEIAAGRGRFDAVIHNAGIGYREPRRVGTQDGLAQVFAVNVLAPYLLTALIERPGRLVYLSSGMHRGGDADLSDAQWERRRWNGAQAYSDSKLFDTVLAFAVARRWPGVRSNAVTPGWVPTKMGGPGAPDDLTKGHLTQTWLAVSDDPAAKVSGGYWHHRQQRPPATETGDPAFQDRLIARLAELTGISIG
jgi:NAD(P)-dependent dehydrogenase (short-subunit alcohol dehydrogenase family)